MQAGAYQEAERLLQESLELDAMAATLGTDYLESEPRRGGVGTRAPASDGPDLGEGSDPPARAA